MVFLPPPLWRRSALFLPPPLWRRAGEGVRHCTASYPPPRPSPTRGEGEKAAASGSPPRPLRERLGQLRLGDHHHTLFRHRETALPVVLQVVTHGRIRRDLHFLVDDRPADAAVAAHVHAVEQNRV